ncbi:sugar ABC transporter substrate-binding protein [Jatrophihabitans telluris]|uniref:Sugar ABC transporter substrate-binding protein n=1 Tax=Jatrophihabitans telluris TaxID=2038343 RepID=A0ABY4QUV1_9ACTN|nr:sugar ABC transporter substrate-binding protein [Jatrophihabitans telluris]UQX87409.1 sugar ABC transporter substrate-binding protein [Jatrophihabitans telluris]
MSITCRRSVRATGLALAAVSSLALAACSSSSNHSSSSSSSANGASGAAGGGSSLPKTLVFSPLSLAPPALKGLSVGIKGYAGSKGWNVVVQDPNFSPTSQVQQLSAVLDSGRAGAAWVIAVDPKSMADTLKAAQSKGIPILVNGKPTEYGYSGAQPGITFDYIDYTAAGKALGTELGNCLTAKNGGSGDVLFSVSSPGQAGKAEFEAAAEAGLKATAPNANIVQKLVVSDRAKGQTDIGNALQGHPNLVGVMASTDEGSLGALGAFSAAGKSLKCDADFGGNDEVLKDVKAGTIFASVALQFSADMAQSFDTLVKMQADPKATGLVLTVPQKTITSAG